jgi:hydrogenase expression/formation protein HypD
VGYIDHAVALARQAGITVTCYGDLIRVPGSSSSLEKARAEGAQVQVVYSPIDALELARKERGQSIVFLGVGFETTAPTTAAAVQEAAREGLENFTVLSAHRVIPPALEALLAPPTTEEANDFRVDGFLAPGHVSTIIGTKPYRFVAEKHRRPVVVAGFSPEDMLLGIEGVLEQLREGRATVENAYRRAVRNDGNPHARALLEEIFEATSAPWRGLGVIENSGLTLRPHLAQHDAAQRFPVELEPAREPPGCQCGLILRGEVTPEDCPLFGKACTPNHPVGACMVSTEGACSAAHRYGKA